MIDRQIKMFFAALSTVCFLSVNGFTQDQNWMVYNRSNSGLPYDYILCLAKDSKDVIWIGGEFGNVTRFDGQEWSVWKVSASEIISLAVDSHDNLWVGLDGGPLTKFGGTNFVEFLPHRSSRYVAVDKNDNVWVANHTCPEHGCSGLLSKFDGFTWTDYDTSNSGLPFAVVHTPIAADSKGIIWAGGSHGSGPKAGLFSFDGMNWMTFSNYVPVSWPQSIAIDQDDKIWIGTDTEGLVCFDRLTSTSFPAPDSNFYFLGAIAIDAENNKWCGFDGGLAKFDGDNWEVYTTSNSPLPEEWVTSIVIDLLGNKWLGTYGGGLALFNENGIVTDVENTRPAEVPKQFTLRQNYPNPFNAGTLISYVLQRSTRVLLTVYNLAGQQVRTLVNESQIPGDHSVVWLGDDEKGMPVSSGLYLYRLELENNIEIKKMLFLR